jgi:hypothetical protein
MAATKAALACGAITQPTLLQGLSSFFERRGQTLSVAARSLLKMIPANPPKLPSFANGKKVSQT